MVPARFQKHTRTPHGFRRCCLFQRHRLKDGYYLSVSYKWINPHFMSCSLAGSALKRRRKEGCARWVPYKSLLLEHWGLCSYTTQSVLFSPKSRTRLRWCWAFPKMRITRTHGATALSCSPPKSKEYSVDGASRLMKITTRVSMSSAAFSCPALSKRDQANETKHCATTKDTHLGSMREICARLPCKNEDYICASYMQSIGSTLHP
jgi:hypothetical protein